MNKRYLPKTPEGKLLHLAEECNELAGIINKTFRFTQETCESLSEGMRMYNPNDPSFTTNRELIRTEIKDVMQAIRVINDILDEF